MPDAPWGPQGEGKWVQIQEGQGKNLNLPAWVKLYKDSDPRLIRKNGDQIFWQWEDGETGNAFLSGLDRQYVWVPASEQKPSPEYAWSLTGHFFEGPCESINAAIHQALEYWPDSAYIYVGVVNYDYAGSLDASEVLERIEGSMEDVLDGLWVNEDYPVVVNREQAINALRTYIRDHFDFGGFMVDDVKRYAKNGDGQWEATHNA